MSMLLPILAFTFASLIVAALGLRFVSTRGSLIDRRLAELTADKRDEGPRFVVLKEAIKTVGSKVPASPSEMGKVRLRLVQAGFRSPEALPIFYGIRVSVAVVAFILLATPL